MLLGVMPALLIVLLGAAYFFGVDADATVGAARNAALIVSGLWLIATSVKLHRALTQAARAVSLATKHATEEAATEVQPAPALPNTVAAAAMLSPAAGATVSTPAAANEEALSLLSLLQEKGRLLDFLMDDVSRYPDAQVGAAARVVHQGCSGVVREYFAVEPLHAGEEGSPLTLDKGYDAHSYRLVGRVTGDAPFRGRVLHRGWLTTGVKLPKRMPETAADATATPRTGQVITPAEVELS